VLLRTVWSNTQPLLNTKHTINNLKVTSENITAAESRIRDTDMADEITAFTKNNVLLQAAQSMLSQSNAVPQNVLSLLR
jgi:flagellin